MVKYVAYKSQDTRNLSEIGLLQNIKHNLTRKGEGRKFEATKGDIDMHAKGKGMLFIAKQPVSGVMSSIDVDVGGVDQYFIKGLSLKIRKFKDFFKGDYESKLFKGNDKMNGSSQSDTLAGFKGNDTINGGASGDTLSGAEGNDTLIGGGGNDLMSGGKGNDFLDGGAGNNSLSGNAGANIFHFDTQLSSSNSSEITDFKPGVDRIELDKSVFPDLSGKGKLGSSSFFTSTDYSGEDGVVVYEKPTGNVFFAVDSNNLVKFAEVSANLNLKASDFFIV